jgi:hypothetical protein
VVHIQRAPVPNGGRDDFGNHKTLIDNSLDPDIHLDFPAGAQRPPDRLVFERPTPKVDRENKGE